MVELLGEGASGAPTVINLLAGLKARLRSWLTLGFALQLPVTSTKDFSSQLVLQPELVWGKEQE